MLHRSAPHSQSTSLYRAAAFACLAALSFSIMGIAIKAAFEQLNLATVVFLRNCFGLLALTPWLMRSAPNSLRSQRIGMHVTRCVIGLSAMYCFFMAISHIPLAEAMLLNYATPLYVPFIAWLWLKERPSSRMIPIATLGLVGVALILKPGQHDSMGWVGLIALGSGVLAAAAFVAIRRLSRTEPALRIVFYFTSLSLLISALPLFWLWTTPSLISMALMAMAGAFASLGQFGLTRAYSLAPAAQVAPFNYLVVVFAALWGVLIWGEQIDVYSVSGALLVVSSSLISLRIKTASSS